MKTIAIMNQKGGIGKTMTAASIAYLLGEEPVSYTHLTLPTN